MDKSEIVTYAVLTALGMALLYCMMWLYSLAAYIDNL